MRTRKWFLPGAVALAVGVLLAVWSTRSTDGDAPIRTRPAASADQAALSLRWHPGLVQHYRVLSQSSMQMQGTTSGPSFIRVDLQGQLDTLTLDSDADQALVGMRMSSIRLEINGTMDAETDRALGAPFRVRFAVNGMPLAFEFPAEVGQKNRSILEGLVRTFQISLDRGDDWVAQERNSSGTYDAAYRRSDGGRFVKAKRRFTSPAAGMVSWSNVDSTESFSIQAGHDWITAMDVAERMTSEGQDGPKMKVSHRATLTLQAGTEATLTASLWDFEKAAAAVDDRATNYTVPDMTVEQARGRIRTTIAELDAAAQGRLAHIHRLRDLLRVDASLPKLVLEVLDEQELRDRTRADLYLALELAGTEGAQVALASVIKDSRGSLTNGMRAIVAMGGIKHPTPESVSALWDAAQNCVGGERQRMASSAAFALGSIGNTMRNAEHPAYASLRSELLRHALGSGDAATRADFITALGNTQDPTLASEVLVLLDDTEPSVRRAVALSLGSLGTDQVAEQLVSRLGREDEGHVRGAIAESLQSWTQPTESAMAMVRQAVRTEADEGTRYHMAILLGYNLSRFPENESVLREIMRMEPSKRIRQRVAEALAGHR